MSSLPTKYRPSTLGEVIGNEDVVDALQALKNRKKKDIPNTLQFYGDSGCGKTTLGRIVAFEIIGCHPDDYVEIDAGQDTGIDNIRETRRKMQYKPLRGDKRVWLYDECHKLSPASQEALLKVMEEAPSHVHIICCTSEPEKLKTTFKRRGNTYQVQSLEDRDIMRLLKKVEKKEDVEEPLGKEVLKQIAKDCLGSPGIALKIMDEIIDLPEEKRLKAAARKAELESESIELCRMLARGKKWTIIRKILKGLQNQSEESIRRHVMKYCNTALLKEENQQAYNILEEMVEAPIFQSGWPALTFACWRICHSIEPAEDDIPF